MEALIIIGRVILWLTGIIAVILIVTTAIHKWLTPREKAGKILSWKGKIQHVDVNGRNISVYVGGSGKKTIVFLSGWGTPSPIADFLPLADRLSSDFRVVIIEFFGYGLSDTTPDIRSNASFVNEIRKILQKLGIEPPYILMPHSISGFYSLYYALHFPKEVEAIIGIDESKPEQVNVSKPMKLPPFRLFTLFGNLGLIRAAAYLLPNAGGAAKVYMNNKNYSSEQVKLYIASAAWNAYSKSMVDEIVMLRKNGKEMCGIKYPESLPVLSFLAKDTVDQSGKMVEKGTMPRAWITLHEEIITNPAIQKIEVLEGSHYLHHTQPDKIAGMTREFIHTHLN